MPAPLPAAHCMQVTHHWDLNGRPGSNRWQIFYGGTWDGPEAQSLVTSAMIPTWDTDLLGHFGAAFQGVEWEVIDLADALHPAIVIPHATIGGGPDACLPNINTLDLYWPVSSRIRGGRSHSFLAGWQTSGLDAGDKKLWSATQIVAAQTFGHDLRFNINGTVQTVMGTHELGVVHYHRAHAVLAPPQFEAFLEPVADSRVHSRSRRLPR